MKFQASCARVDSRGGCPYANLAHCRGDTVLIEGGFEIGGYGSGIAGFDLVAVHHVNRLAVAQNRDGRRRRRVSGEVGTCARRPR